MGIDATTLRRIAAMPEQAMVEALLFLAEQQEELEAKEARLAEVRRKDADRKRIKRGQEADVLRKSGGCPAEVRSRACVEDTNLPSLLAETVSKKDPLVLPPSSSKPLPSDEPQGFSDFWAAYPKRDGSADRKGALKAYTAALRRTPFETIFEGVKRYAAHEAGMGNIGTRFIPQARKWLNNELWTESYETPPRHRPGSMAGNLELVTSAIDRQLAEAEARERNGNENPETIPRLRQSHA